MEDRYSQAFKLDRIRPAVVADGLAELPVRWPGVPIVFCETRQLAEEWTYRYLAAAHTRAHTETAAIARISPPGSTSAELAESTPSDPPARELRAWARANGLPSPTEDGYDPKSSPPGAWRTRHDRRKADRQLSHRYHCTSGQPADEFAEQDHSHR